MKSAMQENDTKIKANFIFHVFLVAFVLIAMRIWYLGLMQYDHYLELSKKPQRRSILQVASRGTIYDRFGIALANNKIQYQAAVYFDPIRHIPRIGYEKNEKGKRIKFNRRKRYIESLALLLSEELDLNAIKIEDMIYSRASIFPKTPFVIKEALSEAQFCRLKVLEKDWPGVQALIEPVRCYPQGKVAANIIGYMGRINSHEHTAIAYEKHALQEFIQNREHQFPQPLPPGFNNMHEVRDRLRSLEQKAYTINDFVGKSGIEGQYDKQLRGIFGKKIMEVDVRGNVLRQLPGSMPSVSGQNIRLTISSELQQFAEALLAHHETVRDKRFSAINKNRGMQPNPWIKGGAIVAMLPDTGEVVTIASYPRFDPNDFIYRGSKAEKKHKLQKMHLWLESEQFIADLWDGKEQLEKEVFHLSRHSWEIERKRLCWESFLESILSPDCEVLHTIKKIETIQSAKSLIDAFQGALEMTGSAPQETIDLLYPSSEFHQAISNSQRKSTKEPFDDLVIYYKNILDPYLNSISRNHDKLLLLDLCKLCLNSQNFSPVLLNCIGKTSLNTYRDECQSFVAINDRLQKKLRKAFSQITFKEWRALHFAAFLKKKRREEKKNKRYEKPYIEYLQQQKKEQFAQFWQDYRMAIYGFLFFHQELPKVLEPYRSFFMHTKEALLNERGFTTLYEKISLFSPQIGLELLQSYRSFRDLQDPLYGKYPQVKSLSGTHLTKHLARAFYPLGGYGHSISYGYQQPTTLGSLFKIITGYESLRQREEESPDKALNPLTIIDDLQPSVKTEKGIVLGYTLEGKPITQRYSGGRLPRSFHRNIGKVDFQGAMEQSSNIYFSLLAKETLRHPGDLLEAARKFGFGQKTGLGLNGEASGSLPVDTRDNVSSLFSFAIGQHTLLVTPIQAAQMMNAIVTKGSIPKACVVQEISGREYKPAKDFFQRISPFPYQKNLYSVGLNFPFFSEALESKFTEASRKFEPQTFATLSISDAVRNYLLDSLYQVMTGPRGSARYQAISYLYQFPKIREMYRHHQHELIGKTSTAEVYYKPTLDRQGKPMLCKHLWFGGVSFHGPAQAMQFEHPELTVIVMLRYGDWGKEAAPLAMQIIDQWRQLQQKYKQP